MTTGTTLVDNAVTNGITYYYVVTAMNAGGESPPSNEVSATPGLPPPASTDLKAVPGDGIAKLTWTVQRGATSYNVKRSGSAGGPYTIVAPNVPLPSTGTVDTFTDSGLTNGVTYYYVVSGVNAVGEGANSNEASVTPVPPPAAVTDLVATPGNKLVKLTWSAPLFATSYTLKRSTIKGGPYNTILTQGLQVTNFTNFNLNNGTTYYYVVIASNAVGSSGNSNEAAATPQAPPVPPTNLKAVPGSGQVTLSWTAAVGATTYNVKRSLATGGPYTVVGPGVATTGFVDTGLTNGLKYYYVVSSVGGGVESGNSAEVNASPQGPPAPTSVTAAPGNGVVMITWALRSGATSYTVKRSQTKGGPYATVQAGITGGTFNDTSVTNGTTYFYVVTATYPSGESGNSTEVSATPATPAPQNVAAAAGDGQVVVTWKAVDNTTYNVKRSTTKGGPYAPIQAATGITGGAYTDTGLTNGTTYYYVVSAVQSGGESANSAEVSATPIAPPAAVADLSAAPGNGQAVLRWSAIAGAASYNVKRATSSGGPYQVVATNVTGTIFTDTGLTNDIVYVYVVSGVNAAGEGPNSNEVFAHPTAATASFVKTDTATQGNWKTVYGVDGFNVFGDLAQYPSYAQVSASGKSDFTWSSTTTDVRALLRGSSPSSKSRIAADWNAPQSFTVDLNLTDGLQHQVALYLLDWDRLGIGDAIEIKDAVTGALLESRSNASLQDGVYLVWNIKGHVQVKISTTTLYNAVLSGLFFN